MTPTPIPSPDPLPPLRLPIEWLPGSGRPEQLLVLLHGWAQEAEALKPLAEALRRQFPQAAVLAPQSPYPADGGRRGAQWYSIDGIDAHETWRERVRGCVGPLAAWVRHQQQRLEVSPAATALGGFSQGGVLALHTAVQHDGIAGRVLAFGARMVDLPQAAPRLTTLHLFHGGADRVFGPEHPRSLLEHLGALQGDATLDVAEGVGHELHPALIQCALQRLTGHIPLRTWREALGAQPEAGRADPAPPH